MTPNPYTADQTYIKQWFHGMEDTRLKKQDEICYKLYPKTEAAIKQYHHEDTICKTVTVSLKEVLLCSVNVSHTIRLWNEWFWLHHDLMAEVYSVQDVYVAEVNIDEEQGQVSDVCSSQSHDGPPQIPLCQIWFWVIVTIIKIIVEIVMGRKQWISYISRYYY